MSLEQYKDANRKELWEILQIQVERIAKLDILHLDPEDIHHCILINLNATAFSLLERAKALKEQE